MTIQASGEQLENTLKTKSLYMFLVRSFDRFMAFLNFSIYFTALFFLLLVASSFPWSAWTSNVWSGFKKDVSGETVDLSWVLNCRVGDVDRSGGLLAFWVIPPIQGRG